MVCSKSIIRAQILFCWRIEMVERVWPLKQQLSPHCSCVDRHRNCLLIIHTTTQCSFTC